MATEDETDNRKSEGGSGLGGSVVQSEEGQKDRESANPDGTKGNRKEISSGESSGKVGGSRQGTQETKEGRNKDRTSPRNSEGAASKKVRVTDARRKLAEIEKRTAEYKARLIEEMMTGNEEGPLQEEPRDERRAGRGGTGQRDKGSNRGGTPSKRRKERENSPGMEAEKVTNPPAIDNRASRLPTTPTITRGCEGLWSLRERVLGWFDPEGTANTREEQKAGKEGPDTSMAGEASSSEGDLRKIVSSLARALNKNQGYLADAKKNLMFDGANITEFLIDYKNLATLLKWTEEEKMDHLGQHVSLSLGRDIMAIVVASRSLKETRDVMMRKYLAAEDMATEADLAAVQRKNFATYNDFLREFTLVALRIPRVTDRIMRYDQPPLDVRDRPYTAMHTPVGQLQMQMTPMGFTNAVADAQRRMLAVAGDMFPEKCEPYIDDNSIKGTQEKDETEVQPGILSIAQELRDDDNEEEESSDGDDGEESNDDDDEEEESNNDDEEEELSEDEESEDTDSEDNEVKDASEVDVDMLKKSLFGKFLGEANQIVAQKVLRVTFNGIKVCTKAWGRLYGCSTTRVARLRKDFRDGLVFCFSRKLTVHDAFDLPELQHIITESYKVEQDHGVYVEETTETMDWKLYIQDHLQNVNDISFNQHFRIKRNGDGEVRIWSKQYHNSQWQPNDREGLDIFKSEPTEQVQASPKHAIRSLEARFRLTCRGEDERSDKVGSSEGHVRNRKMGGSSKFKVDDDVLSIAALKANVQVAGIDKHIITNLEWVIHPRSVRTCCHASLGSGYVLMCGLHNGRHVCNPIIQPGTTLVGVHLGRSKEVRGNTRVIAEVAIIRRHPRGWRDGVVVDYLHVGKMEIPLLVVTNNLSKNIPESPVHDLGLTIRVRMVRRGEAELSAVYLVEPSPESAGKARVTVRYDAQR
ncbi:hypothetical protein CBR_g25992 [Chara braunii]|uniref:DUF7869 domain-containing protein n=1 Tax=Chara braunii TaxID=69332 RepID=A0A388L6X7_CHABU|nr:hypothetical protein CBR_g25992 [Chara braunii]|eukprot:GBG78055.1 hypothetical protein CBR_g25992 [Chara braunii]